MEQNKKLQEPEDIPVVVGRYLQWLFKNWQGTTPEVIGSLYGFNVGIKLNDTKPDKYEILLGSNQKSVIHRNKLYVVHPEGTVEYTYKHGVPNSTNERIASRTFLNSLERVQGLLETYTQQHKELVRDIQGLTEFRERPFSKQEELDNLKAESALS